MRHGFAAALIGRDPQLVGAAAAVHLLAVVLWLTVVRRSCVRQQADTYAERLLETLEQAELTTGPPPPEHDYTRVGHSRRSSGRPTLSRSGARRRRLRHP
jgi:hypothetical protein